MPHRFARTLLPGLVLLLTLSSAAAAQDEAGVAPGDLEGLQRAVSRSYGLDYASIFAEMATPGSNVGPPHGVIFLWSTILEFDSAEHATAAMERLNASADVADGITVAEATVTAIDLPLGDASLAYSEVQDVGGQLSESVLALVRQERFVYFVVLTAVDDDARARTSELVGHMLATPAGEGDGAYSADGASSGGLWAKFPPLDHPLLAGLIAADAIVYPEPTPVVA